MDINTQEVELLMKAIGGKSIIFGIDVNDNGNTDDEIWGELDLEAFPEFSRGVTYENNMD